MPQARYIMIGGLPALAKPPPSSPSPEPRRRRPPPRPDHQRPVASTSSIPPVRPRRGLRRRRDHRRLFLLPVRVPHRASEYRTADTDPDVLIAEPVGSCTDLRATVGYPLCEVCGDPYLHRSPLRPHRPPPCRPNLRPPTRPVPPFSDKILYIAANNSKKPNSSSSTRPTPSPPMSAFNCTPRSPKSSPSRLPRSLPQTGDGLPAWFDISPTHHRAPARHGSRLRPLRRRRAAPRLDQRPREAA